MINKFNSLEKNLNNTSKIKNDFEKLKQENENLYEKLKERDKIIDLEREKIKLEFD